MLENTAIFQRSLSLSLSPRGYGLFSTSDESWRLIPARVQAVNEPDAFALTSTTKILCLSMAVQPRNEPLIYTGDTRAQLMEDWKEKGGKKRESLNHERKGRKLANFHRHLSSP